MEFIFFIIVLISTYFCWKDYRKKVKKAEGEEEIRKAFVPFLLVGFLFVLSVIVFIF